jgi:hypothetical protein
MEKKKYKVKKNQLTFLSKNKQEKIKKDFKKIKDDLKNGNKKCLDYELNTLKKATSGFLIYPDYIMKKKSKEYFCQMINNVEKPKDAIIHNNSLTAWSNVAAEKYPLRIKDILKLKKHDIIHVIFMDRNVGDYMHGTKVGTMYDPRELGLTYATYIHINGLDGIIFFHDAGTIMPFEWELNMKAISDKEYFWGPKPSKLDISKIDPNVRVGWRGPSITLKDSFKLPLKVKHYGNWWNDYSPFRKHK